MPALFFCWKKVKPPICIFPRNIIKWILGKGRGNGARPFSAVPLEPVVRERQGRAICCRGLCRLLSPLYEVGYDALDEL